MTELDEVLTALQQNNETLAEIESELTDLRVEIGNLPEKYIGREEAREKAHTVQKVAMAGASVFFILGVFVFAFTVYVQNERTEACRESRIALRDAIDLSVTEKVPHVSSSPEDIAAIEAHNIERIRPLRERLLSLEGTQPEKC